MSNSRNPSPPTTSDFHGSPASITSDPLVLKYSTMPPVNRSAGRNVHIYDNRNRTTTLGGLILNTGVTNANFYAMIRIIVEFNPPSLSQTFSLRNQSRTTIQEDNQPLQPGSYYIITTGKFLHHPFMIKQLSYKQVRSALLLRVPYPVRHPRRPEPELGLSVKLSVREMVDAL